uniref:ornithine decarboxylase n=1 Tax=Globodera pallida TaxID=36090 RepID=A0A183C1U3_GLOPA
MVLCSGTCPPARIEQIAGRTVAIFEDNVFENGCAEARLGGMVLCSGTCPPARFEQIAGQTVVIFEDNVFENGCAEASLRIAQQLAFKKDENGHDDAFAVLTLNTVIEQFRQWRLMLPRVKPFYAVKCNNDPILLRLLAALGCGFDCASRTEIESVVKNGLASGDNIVYANPCKTRSYIRHAEQMGVRRMTFDSIEELIKIKEMHSSPQLILRIAVADPTAQCPLATKFGCDLDAAPLLLTLAHDHGMELIGISFHVGSGCRDPTAYRLAIAASKKLFVLGTSIGHRMHLLDIGGGFPGHDSAEITFGEIVAVIQNALDDYFPPNDSGDEIFAEIIAEPGRFFGSSPVSLCTNVIAVQSVPASRVTKRPSDDGDQGFMVYINDGVYGSFNCILFDHFQPRGHPLFETSHAVEYSAGAETKLLFPTIIWGQTCMA